MLIQWFMGLNQRAHRCVALGQQIISDPDARELKKSGRKPSGVRGARAPPRFIWLPRMLHMRLESDCLGQAGDAPKDVTCCGGGAAPVGA